MVRWYFTITALKTLLEAAGGSWNADWIRDRKERETGGFLEERVWPKDLDGIRPQVCGLTKQASSHKVGEEGSR